MSIKSRIENIKEYFRQMEVITVDGEQVVYVLVEFPKDWIVDATLEYEYNVTIGEGRRPNEYFFSATIDIGEDEIFNAIEKNVEKMKAAIERAELLRTKTVELKNMFADENNSLEDLRTLTFSFKKEQPKIVTTSLEELAPELPLINTHAERDEMCANIDVIEEKQKDERKHNEKKNK